MPTPSSGLGPTTRCVNGSPNTPLEFSAGFRADDTSLARGDGFQQAEALYLAAALELGNEPGARIRWIEALQRSLVPMETASRRVFAGALAYSPDGEILVSGDYDGGALRIWSTRDGTQVLRLAGHAARPDLDFSDVRGLCFHPDRPREIISVGLDGKVRIWDRVTGKQLRETSLGPKNVPLLASAVEPGAPPGAGRQLVTGDLEGNLVWWELNTLQKVKSIGLADAQQVNVVRYRPDGRQLASAGPDGRIRLWDSEGHALGDLVPPGWKEKSPREFAIVNLAYSPDGRQLASAGNRGRIRVWDTHSFKLLHEFDGIGPEWKGRRQVRGLIYAAPLRLWSAGSDGFVRLWDTDKGTQIGPGDRRHAASFRANRDVEALAIHPGGREIASGGKDGAIRTWDAGTGQPRARLEGNRGVRDAPTVFGTSASAFCVDKHVLITANDVPADAFLRSWDTRTFREQRAYTGLHKLEPLWRNLNRVSALAVHPDGRRFVSSEPTGELVWWDTDTGKVLFKKAAHTPEDPQELAKLAKGLGWAPERVKAIAQGTFSWFTVAGLAWSADGERVASAGADGLFKLWDARDGSLLAQWKDEEPEAPTFPGRTVQERSPELVKLLSLERRLDLPSQGVLLFDRAGPRLITAGGDHVVRLWDLGQKPPRVVDRLRGHGRRVNAGALSADGELLATGSVDGVVILWDVRKKAPVRQIFLQPLREPDLSRVPFRMSEAYREFVEARGEELRRVVRSLAFSPDGQRLAVALHEGSLSLVDVATGNISYRGIGHETDSYGKSAITAYFTRDGELLTVGGDGTVRHWDLPAWSTGRQALSPLQGVLPLWRSWDARGCVLLAGGIVVSWNPGDGRIQVERNGWTTLNGETIGSHNMALGEGRADGKVVVATERGEALVLHLKSGKVLGVFQGPDGKRKLRDPRPIHKWTGLLSPPISAVAVEPNGPLAASSWEGGGVDVWRIDPAPDGRCQWVKTLPPPAGAGEVAGIAFRPDGRQLAVAYSRGPLHLWDVATGKSQFPKLVGPRDARGLCYSPDGKQLLQVAASRDLSVWDPDTGRRKVIKAPSPDQLSYAAGWVYSAAYSPNGKWLATGGKHGLIRLWDTRSYEVVAVLSTTPIRSRARVPDRALISGASTVGLMGSSLGQGPVLAASALFAGRIRVPGPGLAGETETIGSVTFTADSSQVVAVRVEGDIRVYDLQPIQDLLAAPATKLLEETERVTGLRLQGDKLIPVEKNQLAREGETLRPAYRQHPFEFLARASQGNALSQAGRHREARDLLEGLLNEPGVPPVMGEMARGFLANAYIQMGDFARAEAEARKSLAVNPNNAGVRGFLAGSYLARSQFDKAVKVLREALDAPGILPDAEGTTRLKLGVAYWQMGRVADAEVELRKAMKVFSPAYENMKPWAEVYLRFLHAARWRFDLAEKELKSFIDRPRLPPALQGEARLCLARVYLATAEPDKARDEIEKVLRSKPRDPNALLLLSAVASVPGTKTCTEFRRAATARVVALSA